MRRRAGLSHFVPTSCSLAQKSSGRTLGDVRGDLRRENVRIYSEMYAEGIEPFRGNRRSIIVMVLCGVLALSAMLLGFYLVVAVPNWTVNDLFQQLSDHL